MDRRNFLKAAGLSGASVLTVLAIPKSIAEAAEHQISDKDLRKVYRLTFDDQERQIGEEPVKMEDLMPGDVFHMYESDGTPVDKGVCYVCTSEPYLSGPHDVWTVIAKDWNDVSEMVEKKV